MLEIPDLEFSKTYQTEKSASGAAVLKINTVMREKELQAKKDNTPNYKDGYYVKLDEAGDTYYGTFATKVEAKLFVAFYKDISYDSAYGVNLFLKEQVADMVEFEDKEIIDPLTVQLDFPRGYTVEHILGIIKDWVNGGMREYTRLYQDELENNDIENFRKWMQS